MSRPVPAGVAHRAPDLPLGRGQQRRRSRHGPRGQLLPGRRRRGPDARDLGALRQRRRTHRDGRLGLALSAAARALGRAPLPIARHDAALGRGPRQPGGAGGLPPVRVPRAAARDRRRHRQRRPRAGGRRRRARLRGDAPAAAGNAARDGGSAARRGAAARGSGARRAGGTPGAHQPALLLQHAEHHHRNARGGRPHGRGAAGDVREPVPLRVRRRRRRPRPAERRDRLHPRLPADRARPLRRSAAGGLAGRPAVAGGTRAGPHPPAAARERRRAWAGAAEARRTDRRLDRDGRTGAADRRGGRRRGFRRRRGALDSRRARAGQHRTASGSPLRRPRSPGALTRTRRRRDLRAAEPPGGSSPAGAAELPRQGARDS